MTACVRGWVAALGGGGGNLPVQTGGRTRRHQSVARAPRDGATGRGRPLPTAAGCTPVWPHSPRQNARGRVQGRGGGGAAPTRQGARVRPPPSAAAATRVPPTGSRQADGGGGRRGAHCQEPSAPGARLRADGGGGVKAAAGGCRPRRGVAGRGGGGRRGDRPRGVRERAAWVRATRTPVPAHRKTSLLSARSNHRLIWSPTEPFRGRNRPSARHVNAMRIVPGRQPIGSVEVPP